MWPKYLDLSHDECRGILRRLELESYSNVVGAFRAQGSLSEFKSKILKDLREAFHISDDRHKAEIRRAVNDETLSTIAKVIYGPNSEIEWNKEGRRSFLIINRKPSQTALSVLADTASHTGEQLNKKLDDPCNTVRDRVLSAATEDKDTSNLVTSDAYFLPTKSKVKKPLTQTPELDKLTAQIDQLPSNRKSSISEAKVNNLSPYLSQSPTNLVSASSRRRKSTSAALAGSPPPKAILLTSRKDSVHESPSKKHHVHFNDQQQVIPIYDEMPRRNSDAVTVTTVTPQSALPTKIETGKIVCSSPPVQQFPIHRVCTNDPPQVESVNSAVKPKIDLVTERDVYADTKQNQRVAPSHASHQLVTNQIHQGAQIVRAMDLDAAAVYRQSPKPIVKKSQIYPTKTVQMIPSPAMQTPKAFVSHKVSEFVNVPKPVKTHKIDVPKAQVYVQNRAIKNMIPVPSTRDPNIVKANDSIVHISTVPASSKRSSLHFGNAQLPQRRYSHIGTTHCEKKPFVVQMNVPTQLPKTHTRTVTVHPNPEILKGNVSSAVANVKSTKISQPVEIPDYIIDESDYGYDAGGGMHYVTTKPAKAKLPPNVVYYNKQPQIVGEYVHVIAEPVEQDELVYEEQVIDDTNQMQHQNGYIVESIDSTQSNNGYGYHHASHFFTDNNVIYTGQIDEEAIAEEYITTEEFSPHENVIEMEVGDEVVVGGNAH